MTMAEMIRCITDAGATPEVIAAAVDCFEKMSGTSPGQVRDIIRKYERDRKLKARRKSIKNKGNAEANDAAQASQNVPDIRPDSRIAPCNLLTPLSSNSESKEGLSREERIPEKKGGTRARGTRLSPDAKLSDADRQFALANGMSPAEVDRAWAEFVDYWIGIPGQRGTKLDWSATWRNRVRAIGTKGKQHGYRNGSAPRSDLQLALDKARDFAARGDQEYAPVSRDEPPDRH